MSSRIGCIAEQKFQLLCLERDIPIFSPILDNYNIDFIVKKGVKLASVQVKSTIKKDAKRDTYKISVTCGASSRSYSSNAFDYLAVYIFDLNLWYIIPMKEIGTVRTIRINTDSDKNRFHKFKEAWHLLK